MLILDFEDLMGETGNTFSIAEEMCNTTAYLFGEFPQAKPCDLEVISDIMALEFVGG